jgi:hypothetical protein
VHERTSGRDTYGSKAAADGACALGTEVEREVLLLLVELPEVLALLLVRDRQNTRDALADSVAAQRGQRYECMTRTQAIAGRTSG